MSRRLLCLSLLLVVGLNGCTVGPDQRSPVVPLPQTWSELPESGVTTKPLDLTQWWTTFQDPLLNALIERAVATNRDLRVAQGRLREARAQRGVVAADAWPTIDVAGTYNRRRHSENVKVSTSDGNSSSALASDLFQTNFDASWELDLFGRVRRAVEAAEADTAAAEENRRDVLVTVLAEVARNYVELRGFQRQLVVTHRNIQAQRETLDLTQARYQAGLTSELDVAQARAQLATTQSQVPTLETAMR